MRLEGKVSIITGGGGGMGRVAAQMFAAEGAKVVVAEYSEAAGAETVDAGPGGRRRGDVRPGGRLAGGRREGDGRPRARDLRAASTVLYNNAGIMPEADHSVDRHGRRDVGLGHGRQRARRLPRLQVRDPGRWSTAAAGRSSTSRASWPCSAARVPQDAYTASKGAVLSLTRSLAVQFGPKGVRTNAICPGPVETPLLMDWLVKDEAAKQLRLARNPTGRFGKPEEIVHMAVYLASDESRWTNGASLVVDGGITVNYF